MGLELEIVSERELPCEVNVNDVILCAFDPGHDDTPVRFPLVTAHFKGEGVVTDTDEDRLRKQYYRLYELMHDRRWRTLGAIEAATGFPQASISAQLRFMTRQEFGSHTKNRQYLGGGLYQYQIVCNRETCRLAHNDPFHNWLREEERINGR